MVELSVHRCAAACTCLSYAGSAEGKQCPAMAVAVCVPFYVFNNVTRLNLDKHNSKVGAHCAASKEVVMTQ